jgi:benzoate/toluate 1,2-dioxygenase alpha subunit
MTPYVIEQPGEFRVATAAYREPEIFQAELRKLFYGTWIYLGHETEVPNNGDYKTTWIGRQPVILVRSADGSLRCFFNFCTHRGATLCREASGNAKTFTCPYHAWSFRNSGEFVGPPAPERYPPEFKQVDHSLKRIARLESYAGLIFGSLNPAVPRLEAYLGEAKRHVDLWLGRCAGGKYRVSSAHRYAYPGNWKFQAENALDGYHPGFVHQSAFSTFRKFDGMFTNRAQTAVRKIGQTRGFPGGHATLEAGTPLESAFIAADARKLYFEALVGLNGEERAQEIVNNRHILIFPSLILMDANIRVIQPMAADRTEVYSYPALIEGIPEGVASGRLRDVQMRVGTAGMLNPDDVDVFNGMQNALNALDSEIVLSRGLGMEEVLPTGERIGGFSDETPQRSFWREWQARMAQA